jgi:FAD:protein FMN transferase
MTRRWDAMPDHEKRPESAGPPGPPGGIGRRRTLRLLAAFAGIGFPGFAAAGAAAIARRDMVLWRWRGMALGAQAELAVAHPDVATAKHLVGLALGEVERLEAIFSLYRPDSALVQLNSRGYIDRPPLELVELLARSRGWSRLTDGAFDVTVQPLWTLYRSHFSRPDADRDGPPLRELEEATRLVDYRGLEVGSDRIRMARPGMAITLNGIAQGYITDRVADLLRGEGLDRVLVSLGEIRGVGRSSEDRAWRVGLEAPGGSGDLLETIELADQAVATSSAAGLRFDRAGRFHHLLDPLSGGCAQGYRSASVVAARACDADALSTALAVAGRPCLTEAALRDLGVTRITVVEGEGRVRRLL